MNSSAENKTCGVCLGNLQGQAIFTSECSHSFHFTCISNSFAFTNHLCPTCHSKWNHVPFTMPNPNTNTNHTNIFYPPSFNIPSRFAPLPSSLPRLPLPPFTQVPPQPRFVLHNLFDTEPLHFSDDDPLPNITNDPMSSCSQKVSIRAVPERSAVAASESVSLFSVLVGLKAPSLSDDARSSQRAAIDLVTVLDVSGSMRGSKLALLKQAVHFVIDNLGPSDRLSIVAFSHQTRRILPLRRMTENGYQDAKRAVDSLIADGGTNIVEGLKKGVRVLEERQYKNPVTSIIFLSDGNDTCNFGASFSHSREAPAYLNWLPASICPRNRCQQDQEQLEMYPVHSFGFGADHDPIAMHAISDASGGTFSFIESYEMVQDAFAGCIGGLLSVVTQKLHLTVRSASHGVEIKLIPSGRYASEILNQGSQGLITVGNMYAEEEKDFLINLFVPLLSINENNEENERKTSLLDIKCSYWDVVSKELVRIEGDLVEIRRPKSLSPQDTTINLEVDRQRNRLRAAESIAEAQQMAERGNLTGARNLLRKRRSDLMATASAQAGDGLCTWLEADIKETEQRMVSHQQYQQSGRAYALSGMSSHALQRATTKGNKVAGEAQLENLVGASTATATPFGAYATPQMARMVKKSQQLNKSGDSTTKKE
ncbi:hypothetical protein CDL12_02833 [Handroanthus impetiginosus]|uniref:Anaphase-promoting complex (APC), subunit 11 n=1 Tax=Handroanthus impetiginosus TaxID=429701 RepID=A0A2G9I3V6_9LAMI|nr:hypothetical protein CDL12_02833 [Handroanthus impetiginosus]